MAEVFSAESFTDESGNKLVFQYIDGLDYKNKGILYSAIEILREHGHLAFQMKAFKRFNDHLSEITKGDYRVIFLRDGNHFELLHGFPKNSQKTLNQDKVIAEERYQEYWRRKNR
jgi:phage-related protein